MEVEKDGYNGGVDGFGRSPVEIHQNFDIWPIKCGIPSLLELLTAVSNQFTHKNRIFQLTFDGLIHRGSRSVTGVR